MAGVERSRDMEEQRSWFSLFLAKRQHDGFYGTLTLKFEKGELLRVVEEKTFIPPKSERNEVQCRG